MNLATYPSPTRDAPSATRELAIETRAHHEIEAAMQFRAFLAAARVFIGAIASDLSWLHGYDKETVLALLDDMEPPADAAVERWADENFLGDE